MSAATATDARGEHPHRAAVPAASPLTGLGSLVRLYGRISRRQIIIWTLAMLAMVPASVLAMKEAYPDAESLDARAMLLDNPSAVMMTGPAFAHEQYTFWAMVANELVLYILIAVAIMSVLMMVRHTRAEEEAGRLELIRSLPTGRLAPPAAALLIVGIADVLVGLAVTIGVLVTGGPGIDSLALGLATAGTGMVFAAIAAVAAQLTEHAGTASGAALGALALAFMVRGIGDVLEAQGSWLSWFSPLAWAQQTRVYVDLRWWPLAVSLAVIAAALVIAGALSRRRDVGAGLRPASAGADRASAALLAPGGLPGRLVTPMMLAWTIGLFLFAAAFGALASSLEDMVGDLPALGEWAPIRLEDLTTSFAAYVLMMLSLGPIGLVVAGVLRLRTEEQEGRLAGVLLAGSSRTRIALRWLLVVAAEAFVVQVLLGLGVGLGVWQATGESRWVREMTAASLTYLSAVALFAGLALALYGLRLRLAGLAWALMMWTAIVTLLGDLLGLPDWARSISPLHHVPLVPDAEMEAWPLVIMGILAVLLAAIGLFGLRRRDLVAG